MRAPEVGEHQEHGAAERAGRHQQPVPGAGDHPDQVRHDQPDEGDDPAEGDGRGGQHRDHDDRRHPQPLDVDADVAGGAVAEGEQVELAGQEHRRGESRRRPSGRPPPTYSQREPLRLPRVQKTISSRAWVSPRNIRNASAGAGHRVDRDAGEHQRDHLGAAAVAGHHVDEQWS